MLNNELIILLKKFDTPTISNALDIYRGSRSSDGYTKYPFISANHKLEPIVGIARTAKIRASNPPILSPEKTTSIRLKYYEYIINNINKKNTLKIDEAMKILRIINSIYRSSRQQSSLEIKKIRDSFLGYNSKKKVSSSKLYSFISWIFLIK